MSTKPKTRAQLEARIAELEQTLKDEIEAGTCSREQIRKDLAAARECEKRTVAKFDDLKTRLAHAEGEVHRMRGYIQRVQEDDVAREDLVKVGDPEGSHQLVPKRKPTFFGEREYGGINAMTATDAFADRYTRDRVPPKHWVTY